MNRRRRRDQSEPTLLQHHPPCIMRTNLLVIGASARWFAESARRGGWQVGAIDLFNDQDLEKACSQVIRLSSAEYPAACPARAAAFPPGPVVYGGGLENHPSRPGSPCRCCWMALPRNPHRPRRAANRWYLSAEAAGRCWGPGHRPLDGGPAAGSDILLATVGGRGATLGEPAAGN
jgi:hypothetical protein